MKINARDSEDDFAKRLTDIRATGLTNFTGPHRLCVGPSPGSGSLTVGGWQNPTSLPLGDLNPSSLFLGDPASGPMALGCVTSPTARLGGHGDHSATVEPPKASWALFDPSTPSCLAESNWIGPADPDCDLHLQVADGILGTTCYSVMTAVSTRDAIGNLRGGTRPWLTPGTDPGGLDLGLRLSEDIPAVAPRQHSFVTMTSESLDQPMVGTGSLLCIAATCHDLDLDLGGRLAGDILGVAPHSVLSPAMAWESSRWPELGGSSLLDSRAPRCAIDLGSGSRFGDGIFGISPRQGSFGAMTWQVSDPLRLEAPFSIETNPGGCDTRLSFKVASSVLDSRIRRSPSDISPRISADDIAWTGALVSPASAMGPTVTDLFVSTYAPEAETCEAGSSEARSFLSRLPLRWHQMWEGACDRLETWSADRTRQALVSLRELFTHILRSIAPKKVVRSWFADQEPEWCVLKPNGEVSVRAQLTFLVESGAADLAMSEVGDTRKFIASLNRLHEETVELSDSDLSTLFSRSKNLLAGLLDLA